MYRLATIFLAPVLALGLTYNSTETSSGNAAVKYLRADAALRQSYPLSPNAAGDLEKALEAPITADEEKMVAAAEEAMVELLHGAETKHCDWMMSHEDGPLTNTSHRGAIREIVAVAGLRARIRFRDGDVGGAMTDVVAAMAAARHLTLDGSITSVLLGNKLEREVSVILAEHLKRLSPPQLSQLSKSIGELPKASDMATAIADEKIARKDLSNIAQSSQTRAELVEALAKGIPTLRGDRKEAAEIVDGCGGSADGFQKCISQQDDLFALIVAKFNLKPEEFEKVYSARLAELSVTNTVVKRFTPMMSRLRWAEAQTQTRRAILRAAIAVCQDGSKTLSQHLDPYDNLTFAYIPTSGGFTLTSQLRDDSNQIALVIGN